MGRVEAICISEKKGQRKRPVEAATFRSDYGIESDAHAGAWHRQVSLLAAEDIEAVRRSGLGDLAPGDFAENLVLAGVELGALGLGTRLRLGEEVVVSITQIGKVCHAPCRIYELTGDCIMPRRGLFARVQRGGRLRVGDAVEVLELVGRELFQVVVLTVSDRRWRGQARDTAGPAVANYLTEAVRCHVYRIEIVPDEREVIEQRLRHYCDGHSIDLVVTVGGTGFSPRDVTPEATASVLERAAPGLAEAMRAASLTRTPHAMLSRGLCGIRGATLVVNLPGSERAAVENISVIVPALTHGLEKLRGDPAECGRGGEAPQA